MLVQVKVRPAQRPRSACLRGRPCRMSRASGLALAAVLVVLCAGRLAAASLDPGREADPPCKKAAASQDPDGEELVGLFSTKTKELLDDKGAAHAKPAVVVIFMNLDGGKKQTQYVLKRARKVAAERRGLAFAVASLKDSKDDMVDGMVKATLLAAASVANTARAMLTLAQGCPLGPSGEPSRWDDHEERLRQRCGAGVYGPDFACLGPSRRTTGSLPGRTSTYAWASSSARPTGT